MKARRLTVGFALLFGLAGCGESQAKTVMPDVEDRQLDVALSDIKRAGFKDEVDVDGGGTFGIRNKSNWKVCDQSPAAGQTLKGAPRLTVDRSCDDDAADATESTKAPTTTPTTTSEPEPKAEESLTAANNSDFAALLAVRDNCSDTINQFASTYRGRTLEFDGNIAAMNKHGDSKTRYDILVIPGDFSESNASNPTFQFRDVNTTYDLHLTGDVPDSVGRGDNLHVIARVDDYESSTCLFLLEPVSTQVR